MKKTVALIVMLLLAGGCTSKRQIPGPDTVVPVPVSESQNTDITSVATTAILLEEGNTIGPVKGIFQIDSVFYIHHGQIMSRYDIQGHFLRNVSHPGRGPNEYLTLWYSWIRDRSVFLYDLNGSKVLSYNTAIGALSERATENQGKRFQAAIPFGEGYIGKMGYDGTDDCAELGFFDENYRFIDAIEPLKLYSGLWLGNPFSRLDEKEVLYWRQLENDIYAIRSDSPLSIKYRIDFIDRNVPERDFADEYEKIEFINSDPNAYAAFLSNVLETEDRLFFTFLFQAKKYLAVFDKVARQTKIHHFALPEYQTLSDIFPTQEGVFIIASAIDGNSTIIYTLDL